ncbi:MAG TPA: hypothetical protein VLH18_01720 [Candidatus Limnocylindrales bacterium]|nr:hypothetical protein [Candidatus Limnocylindrales bacterium]
MRLLWDLQQIDLSIRELVAKIEEAPLLSGVQETADCLEKLKSELIEVEKRLKEDRKVMKNLEMDVQKLVEDRKILKDSLYGGKISNIKELEQMHRKMELLTERKDALEDKIMTFLELIEEQEAFQREHLEKIDQCTTEYRDMEKRLSAALQTYVEEKDSLEQEREIQAGKIEAKYMDKYLTLAQKYRGQGMASVVNDICGVCRVFISSALRGRLYNPDALVYCENCGRLLIKLEKQ